MPWVEIFVVFLVSHLVGDFLFQTEWQAVHKRHGLGPDPVARRALLTHGLTYTLSYVPALIWLASDLGAGAILVALLIGLPHVVQDDGRLVEEWGRRVKKVDRPPIPLMVAMDQSFHAVALLLTAILCGS
jgi:hypothetical protein